MDILSILAAALAGWVFGAVWYMALSRPWLRATGISPTGDRPKGDASPVPFILSAVTMVLVATFMEHLFALAGIETLGQCALYGFGIGLLFISSWTMINNAYPGRPFALTLIDGGYATFGCAIIGLVLAIL